MCYILALHIGQNRPAGQNRCVFRVKSWSIFQTMGIGILRRIKCDTYLHYILSQIDQQDKLGVFQTKIWVNFPTNGDRHSAQDQMCYILTLHIEPNGPT